MSLYYLETSALVKLYVREPGTDRVLALTDRSLENRLAILSLSRIEFRSAVRRRERNQELASQLAAHLLDAFDRHMQARFIVQAVTDSVLDLASVLIDRHSLRAYDAVQLAGCSVLRDSSGSNAPVFVCADHSLLTAATKEGMVVLDPSAGP